MKKRSLLPLASLALASASSLVSAQPYRTPNIVLIIADDAGYHDFGFQDNPALEKLTPNLDQLCREGVRFTNAYANASMCAPSRAGLLTGRFPHRFGFQQNYPESDSTLFATTWQSEDWKKMGLDTSEKTVADHLKANGYATALIGKWHLGYDDVFYPTRRGFDEFYGLRGGSRPYVSTPSLETAPAPAHYDRIEHNGALVPEKDLTYITDDLTNAAIRFIEQNREHPFFIYLSYTAPHVPLLGTKEDVEWVEKNYPGLAPKRVQNLATLRRLDFGVGQVRAKLKELGLSDNTVVIFAVDNGGSVRSAADNSPFRGHKFSPFEGGIRVPLIVDWPGVTKPDTVNNRPVLLFDLTPTFVEMAGGRMAAGAKPFDGISLTPVLRGDKENLTDRFQWREINSEGPTNVTRSGNYKLIQYEKKPAELYDVESDPGEKNNVATQLPKIVEQLKKTHAGWDAQMITPRWYQN